MSEIECGSGDNSMNNGRKYRNGRRQTEKQMAGRQDSKNRGVEIVRWHGMQTNRKAEGKQVASKSLNKVNNQKNEMNINQRR